MNFTNVMAATSLIMAVTALANSYRQEYWNRHQELMKLLLERPWNTRQLCKYARVSWPAVRYFLWKHYRNGNLAVIIAPGWSHYYCTTHDGVVSFKKLAHVV